MQRINKTTIKKLLAEAGLEEKHDYPADATVDTLILMLNREIMGLRDDKNKMQDSYESKIKKLESMVYFTDFVNITNSRSIGVSDHIMEGGKEIEIKTTYRDKYNEFKGRHEELRNGNDTLDEIIGKLINKNKNKKEKLSGIEKMARDYNVPVKMLRELKGLIY